MGDPDGLCTIIYSGGADQCYLECIEDAESGSIVREGIDS